MNDEPLTGVRKRQQIEKTNRQMLIWVAIAALVVTIGGILAVNFIRRISYQAKVNGRLGETSKTLSTNIETIGKLIENVNTLQTNQGLLSLRNNPTDTAFQVVLDALPTVNDSTSLASSLQQKILGSSGVEVTQISVVPSTNSAGGTGTAASSTAPTIQSLQFSFVMNGDLATIVKALQNVENSIRPITINSLSVQAGGDNLQVTITATTSYLPRVNYQLSEEEVQP